MSADTNPESKAECARKFRKAVKLSKIYLKQAKTARKGGRFRDAEDMIIRAETVQRVLEIMRRD